MQAGDIKIDPKSDSQKRTESILLCIDYSHSNLSPDAQQLLLCLAPFTSVFDLDLIEAYTTQLRQQPVLSTLPFECWSEVLQEAANWGLLSPDATIPSYLHLQPILPYFLRNRLGKPEQAEIKQAVEIAFRQLYDQVGATYYQWLVSKDPQERQAGQVLVSLEYENLVTALNLALIVQTSILKYYNALSKYLEITQDKHRGLELGQMILHLLENYPAEKLSGGLGTEFAAVIDGIAMRQLLLKDFAAAEASYQKALTILLGNKSLDSDIIKKLSASVYHQLGMVAQQQHQWTQAEQYYQQALQIYVEYHDRYLQASTYHGLGIIAQEQRQWTQARDYFLRALEIYVSYDEKYYRNNVLSNLARLWQDSDDKGLPAAIAVILNAKVDEVEELLRQANGDGDDKQSK